jgi:hypothetical protein
MRTAGWVPIPSHQSAVLSFQPTPQKAAKSLTAADPSRGGEASMNFTNYSNILIILYLIFFRDSIV